MQQGNAVTNLWMSALLVKSWKCELRWWSAVETQGLLTAAREIKLPYILSKMYLLVFPAKACGF